jgi:hypothetical protein
MEGASVAAAADNRCKTAKLAINFDRRDALQAAARRRRWQQLALVAWVLLDAA